MSYWQIHCHTDMPQIYCPCHTDESIDFLPYILSSITQHCEIQIKIAGWNMHGEITEKNSDWSTSTHVHGEIQTKNSDWSIRPL